MEWIKFLGKKSSPYSSGTETELLILWIKKFPKMQNLKIYTPCIFSQEFPRECALFNKGIQLGEERDRIQETGNLP